MYNVLYMLNMHVQNAKAQAEQSCRMTTTMYQILIIFWSYKALIFP